MPGWKDRFGNFHWRWCSEEGSFLFEMYANSFHSGLGTQGAVHPGAEPAWGLSSYGGLLALSTVWPNLEARSVFILVILHWCFSLSSPFIFFLSSQGGTKGLVTHPSEIPGKAAALGTELHYVVEILGKWAFLNLPQPLKMKNSERI